MGIEKIPFERFTSERPPAVVLGDLSLIRPIAMASIPQLLVTPEARDVALRSRCLAGHHVVPGFEPPHADRSIEQIIELGTRLRYAIGRKVPLFYNSDKNLELIYRHRAKIEEHYLLLLNDEATAWALHQKDRFYPLAESAGVLVPKTLRSARVIESGIDTLREPILVKPTTKTAWRAVQKNLFDGKGKARVFSTKQSLCRHPGFEQHKDEIVVQEFIPGGAGSLYSFHGFADDSAAVLAGYVGRKIRTFPEFAGESCFVELVKDPTVNRVGRDVVRKLGIKGVFKIDFIRDATSGELYTLEINARFNLWNHLGAVCGVNLPSVAYDYLVFGRVPRTDLPYEPRHRWINAYRDYLAFRGQGEERTLKLWEWLGALADPRTVHETFAWTDPMPFAQWTGEFIRGKFGLKSTPAVSL